MPQVAAYVELMDAKVSRGMDLRSVSSSCLPQQRTRWSDVRPQDPMNPGAATLNGPDGGAMLCEQLGNRSGARLSA